LPVINSYLLWIIPENSLHKTHHFGLRDMLFRVFGSSGLQPPRCHPSFYGIQGALGNLVGVQEVEMHRHAAQLVPQTMDPTPAEGGKSSVTERYPEIAMVLFSPR
jgi:hypothetical protein